MVGRIPVMDVKPLVDLGRQPAKATVGEPFPVSATIFREGHDQLGADVVLIGTPIDLRRLIEIDKPSMRVTYRLQELDGGSTLAEALAAAGVTGASTLVGGPAA